LAESRRCYFDYHHPYRYFWNSLVVVVFVVVRGDDDTADASKMLVPWRHTNKIVYHRADPFPSSTRGAMFGRYYCCRRRKHHPLAERVELMRMVLTVNHQSLEDS